MEPITFNGDGYARYTLLDSGTVKQQVAVEMAFYGERISMKILTDAEEGLLFRMGGTNDFAILEVSLLILIFVLVALPSVALCFSCRKVL